MLFTSRKKQFVLWFKDLSSKDVALVGGKTSSLGEMYNKLHSKGIPIPGGFAVTAYAYRTFIKENHLESQIKLLLSQIKKHNVKTLQKNGEEIRSLILAGTIPKKIEKEIVKAYEKMEKIYGSDLSVAVRSSATAEDLPGASFAGQQESYLNIKGAAQLVYTVRRCFASLYTDRAISYREDKGFEHSKVYLSVAVQKMVRADKASSGVIFTIDTESGFKDALTISSAYGLGETVVQGKVNPDEFFVHKPTLKLGYKSIILKKLGSKKIKMIYSAKGTRQSIVAPEDSKLYSITDPEALELARYACIIEDHYGMPMDIEWAKDGGDGKLYILQARPETIHAMKTGHTYTKYNLKDKGKLLVQGLSIGEKIGSGKVNVIHSAREISKFKDGEVLVTSMTDPDWEPIMKKAGAIVTERGGRACHAAIVSRELGVPCIVGATGALRALNKEKEVTISCAEGETGNVYRGKLEYSEQVIKLDSIPKTKTAVMMNLGLPEKAFKLGQLPTDGIGLAREEFIISDSIRIHPLALLNYLELRKKKDPITTKIVKEIDELTFAYSADRKREYYIDKLTQGVAQIAAAFYPKPVIVRFSDFKTNEYRSLIGGELFEPVEENPMIGWRGASRYYSKEFRPAFELECKAITKVRKEMGLKNVKVMIPFCRTLEEARKVLKILAKNGLKRSREHLEVYMMVEIPSDVILLEDFCKLFDGFSIGSNDLTQLVLGVDRDSQLISNIYDERNAAVRSMVLSAIRTAKRKGRKIGICGDAPSTYREFTKFLVKSGIDSVSVSPDVFLKVKFDVAKIE